MSNSGGGGTVRGGGRATVPPAPDKAMWNRVMDFFVFLDTPDRVWARDYVLGWRNGASELSKDLAGLVRGIGGVHSAPFQGFCMGPATDGSGIFANELVTLMVPVARAGNVTVGVYLDKMSIVDGHAPFTTPAMPTVEDGLTRSRGRFALDCETGELVSLACTPNPPRLFPGESMTSMFHWRSQGNLHVFTNSYIVDDLLPNSSSPLRAVDLSKATLQSSTFCFNRFPCATCGALPPGCSPCVCASLDGARRRETGDDFPGDITDADPFTLRECSRLARTRAVEETLNGQFQGVSRILIRLQPTSAMIAVTRPGVYIRLSFIDDPTGDVIAAEMQKLSIRAIVQSAAVSSQRPVISHRPAVAYVPPSDEACHRKEGNSRRPESPEEIMEVLTDQEPSRPSFPLEGEWGSFTPSPPSLPPEPAPVLEPDTGCTMDFYDPMSSSGVGAPANLAQYHISAPAGRDESRQAEKNVRTRSAADILEERKRKNRQSAKMSGLRQKRNVENLERNVRQIRVVRIDLEVKKAALEAENARLREQLGNRWR